MAIETRPALEDSNVVGMLRSEIEAINERRRALARDELPVRAGCESPARVIDAVGLALSGGGIRSAAVSLGVLQALNHHGVLRNVDYLSTVSGGGYMGTSLTATMTKSDGRFVFGNPPQRGAGAPLAAEISDTDEVGHIRNYANYLVPGGARDVVTAIAILTRGLVANLGTVLPIVLLFAAATIWTNPYRSSLECTDLLGLKLCPYISLKAFGITLILALLGLALFFAWAIARSFFPPRYLSEFRGRLPFIASSYLIVLALVFFIEGQSFVIDGMFQIADAQAAGENVFLGLVTSWVKMLAAITAPVAAIVMFFRGQFAEILKAAGATSRWTMQIAAIAIRIAIWVAGFALPLLIWVAYLYFSYWGIINDQAAMPGPAASAPAAIVLAAIGSGGQESNYRGELDRDYSSDSSFARVSMDSEENKEDIGGAHTPRWLLYAADQFSKGTVYLVARLPWLPKDLADHVTDRLTNRPLISLYVGVGALLFLLSLLLAPNANSPHRLYRDRLSKAFLFNPNLSASAQQVRRNEPSIDQGRDFAPLDDIRISELSAKHAPYHLINSALNIQGSDYANRRGRNADFFLFSPRYIGSYATGYAPMKTFEHACPGLDLATAMAISGGAASSNMGAKSIRALTPTLALLNVRLGYWLKNPRFYSPSSTKNPGGRSWVPMHRLHLYLWSEIAGRLYENADEIYLTDGGHIENLGIYELLRRRCKVIIVVDTEADLTMHFPSLITLQRYARIDLGIRIFLPWLPIQTTTLAQMALTPETPSKPSPGPHAAVGTIDYGGGETGYLVYVKSSLTGDENDYIRDYARRYNRFPHEITLDQLFSEEQFEVYRALGFHMAHGFLDGGDGVCVTVMKETGEPEIEIAHFTDDAHPVINAVRSILLA